MDRWLSIGLVVALVAVIAILGFPALHHLRETAPPVQPPIHLSFTVPSGVQLGAGDEILDAAISPDDRKVAFVVTEDGTPRLWVRDFGNDDAQIVRGSIGAQLPAWKQTGNVIAFFANARLKLYTLVRNTVADLGSANAPSGASWLLDGSLLFAPDARGPIRRVLNGTVTDATKLRPGDRSHTFPMAIGQTSAFVYTATRDDGTRMVRLVEGERERDLTATTGHGQIVGDVLLFTREGVLVGQRLNADTRALDGPANAVATGVGVAASGHALFAASPRMLLSASSVSRPRQLTWFTTSGQRIGVIRDPADYWQVRLSPDDRFAAVTTSTPLLRTLDIVVVPMSESSDIEAVTRAVAADSDPVWSSDGQHLIFRSLQDGQPKLFTHALHNTDAGDELLASSKPDDTPSDWRDGRVLLHAPTAGAGADIWSLTIATGARDKVATTSFNETDARLSPDGRSIAYVSDESGSPDIYVSPWPSGQRIRVSFGGGTRPRWSRDGRALFFQRGPAIMRADSLGSRFATPSDVLNADVRDFDVAHRSDALIALVPTAATNTPTVSVLVDWQTAVPAIIRK